MNLFYNKKSVGDVLLIQLTTEQVKSIETKTVGDVTVLIDQHSEKVVGFNIFNGSDYLSIEENGQVELTDEIVNQIQAALNQNGVQYELNVDLTPKFVVGQVMKKEKHPNADKLSVCIVDVGTEQLQIVCGAANVDVDQKVVVAKVGAVMPSGLVIRDAELRGVASSGMICSASELALPNAEENVGILVLDDSSRPGQPFSV